jgi:RNA polymerase sigma-70 factor (ECF subfamily)
MWSGWAAEPAGHQPFLLRSVFMTDDTDAELVSRCRNGDRLAFDALLTRYELRIFNAAFRILHHSEDAIDVTQTAFLNAYEHLGSYDQHQQFSTWLYRIVVNQALDLVRRRRSSESLGEDTLDDHDGPVELAIREQTGVALQRALMALKIEYRIVIVLKHVQGCSYEEMAQILDCPVKTVKSRLFTAREALRDVLVARREI